VIALEYFPKRINSEGSIQVNLDAKFCGNEIQSAVSQQVLHAIFRNAFLR